MSSTATSPHNGNPVLPLEIELEIFTTAAMVHQETIPTLLRVARRVLIWIEPLYKTLIFGRGNGHATTRLPAAIQGIRAKPLAFREQVRDVLWWSSLLPNRGFEVHNPNGSIQCCILEIDEPRHRGWVGDWWWSINTEHDPQEKDLYTLLSICHGFKSLAFCGGLSPFAVEAFPLDLQRLTMELWPYVPTPSSCAALTHLHIFYSDSNSYFSWINILPSLTHFCLDSPDDTHRLLLETLLKENRQLRVCIFTFLEDDPRVSGPWIDEDRVVIIPVNLNMDDYIEVWKAGAAGGRDFWVHAEEFLSNKRKDKTVSRPFCDYRLVLINLPSDPDVRSIVECDDAEYVRSSARLLTVVLP
ncbi:hypothetical protein DFH06DRAFT_1465651 [Mycena polygramma]|nr:hypothetical protein DFH06DRAFT_1465651 [Mycena polygramma]